MEQYSVDEVVVWLTEKGFDEDVQKCFRGIKSSLHY